MALSWCKVASNLDSHPKIRRAGRSGREVFLFALRRNAEPDNQVPGVLPPAVFDPDYLADMLMMTRDEAVTGVTAAVTAGLLRDHGDHFEIVGWEEDWGKVRTGSATSGAERTAKWRENKKLRTAVTTRDGGDVTEKGCDVTRDAGDGVTLLDKKREEEKREDLSGKPDAAALFAQAAVGEINRLTGKTYRPETSLKLCRALVKAKHTPEQAIRVVQSKREWIGDPKMGQFFRPSTLLAAANFAKYLDDLEAGPARFAQGTQTVARMSSDREEARSPLMLAFDKEAARADA